MVVFPQTLDLLLQILVLLVFHQHLVVLLLLLLLEFFLPFPLLLQLQLVLTLDFGLLNLFIVQLLCPRVEFFFHLVYHLLKGFFLSLRFFRRKPTAATISGALWVWGGGRIFVFIFHNAI